MEQGKIMEAEVPTVPVGAPRFFLQAGCPSCRPTNSVKALKAHRCSLKKAKGKKVIHVI